MLSTLAFPLLVLMESAYGELNSWVWGSFCKLLCVLWLVSLDNLVQWLTANLYFSLCLKVKSVGQVTECLVATARFWHYSADNFQVPLLDFSS